MLAGGCFASAGGGDGGAGDGGRGSSSKRGGSSTSGGSGSGSTASGTTASTSSPATSGSSTSGGAGGDGGFASLSILAGQPGGAGDANGTGAAARFYDPSCVATDGAGNLYVADSGNNTIRRIVVATGAVTTLAGTAGWQGGSTDGTGATARFFHPDGLAYDGAGNVYVADSGNNTIRKVVLGTGTVTTFAGSAVEQGSADGTGAAATFNKPMGLAYDGAGNLYVADYGNNTIRRIALATGAVTTLAGTAGQEGSADGTGAAASFLYPQGLACDGAGNLYVADSGNVTIRKIVAATATVTTLAGTAGQSGSADGTGAAASFDYPTGLACDGAGNLYIGDTTNEVIRTIVVATGAVSTLAGLARHWGSADGAEAAARFCGPEGLAYDGAGNLYVADSSNDTIRQVAVTTAAVTTLAGTAGRQDDADGTGAAASFNLPGGLAYDGTGSLYVADTGNDTIRQIALATAAVTTLAGTAGQKGSADGTGAAARFSGPFGLAYDGMGNLYITDSGNDTIRKVAVATAAVTTLAGTPGKQGSADGTGVAASFNGPLALAYDGAGNLYVADSGNDTIRKIAVATGAVTTLAGTAGQSGSADGTGAAARFYFPQGLAYDGSGNLYVADTYNGTIRKIVVATAEVTTVLGVAGDRLVLPGPIGQARLNTPVGLALGAAGMLFISDFNENVILAAQ